MMTCSATLRHNAGEAAGASVRRISAQRVRRGEGAQACGWAWAPSRLRAQRALRLPILCRRSRPAAPPSFGARVPIACPLEVAAEVRRPLRDASPLFAVFIAERSVRGTQALRSAPRLSEPDNSHLRREHAARSCRRASAAGRLRPHRGPALSPIQSALRAALERLVTRGDQPQPSGQRRLARRARSDRGLLCRRALTRRCGSARTA